MRRLDLVIRNLLPVVGLATVLAGCGFQPLYQSEKGETAPKALVASVAVAPIPDRIGQLTRNALEHRIEQAGHKVAKVYTLSVSITETLADLSIQKDATATRGELRMTASFSLTKAGKAVWSGSSQTVTSYNVMANRYATTISQNDARERGSELIADDIVQRLAVFLSRQSTP